METIQEFIDLIALRLTDGPLEDIVARHGYPFPMETALGPSQVLPTPEDHLLFLAERRLAMAERGVVRVVPQLVGTDPAREGMFRAWVRWRHLTALGRLDEESGSVLFLRSLPRGRLRVEAAQFLRAPMQRRSAVAGSMDREGLWSQEVGANPGEPGYDRAVTIARPGATAGRLGPGPRMSAPDEKPLKVTAFFERMGQLFSEGRLGEVADLWHFPSPIMIGTQIHLMRTRADLLDYLTARRDAGLAAGLISIAPLIAAVEIPRYGRLRVWLRWRTTYDHGVVDDAEGSVFYLSRSPQGTLCVEMMESIPRYAIESTRATA